MLDPFPAVDQCEVPTPPVPLRDRHGHTDAVPRNAMDTSRGCIFKALAILRCDWCLLIKWNRRTSHQQKVVLIYYSIKVSALRRSKKDSQIRSRLVGREKNEQ
eukprot:scaffold5364_cov164-Amphora_coffeaeformis.AAC.5